MKIKDFKVGDTVYIVGCERAKDKPVQEEIVSKVGRKYVSVGSGYGEDKYEVSECHEDANYLVEHKDWGTRKQLYKSMEDIATEREIGQIRRWLFGTYSGAQNHRFTIGQLRAVRDILSPNGEYDTEINAAR